MLRKIFRYSSSAPQISSKTTHTIIQKRLSVEMKPERKPLTRTVSEAITIPSPKHKHKRKRYSYSENHTAAIELVTPTDVLESKQHEPMMLLQLSKENILEHSRRRVELFFYILVAYYQSGLMPEQGHITLQYGRGRNSPSGQSITQACHSSLFGSLVDDNEDSDHSLLSGTHFAHSLNSTVELPAFVNKFDDELENDYGCRTKGLSIIRQVSLGEINPIEGMNQFFKMLSDAFNKMKKGTIVREHSQPYLLRDTPDAPIEVKEKLLAFIEQGTFAQKWDEETQTVNQKYVDMLLRITPEKSLKNLKTLDQLSNLRLNKIKELREELLEIEESEIPTPDPEYSDDEPSEIFKLEI